MSPENWDYADFKAYLFIYCSFADHLQVTVERNFVIDKVGNEKFYKQHKQIEMDTDEISIHKIKKYIKQHNITKEVGKELFSDVRDMFLSDGEFHKLEKRLYGSLERIFKKDNLI